MTTSATTAISLTERLSRRAQEIDSLVCVGLDPILERFPVGVARTPDGVVTFCREVIAATAEHALAYKPNLGFFMALGRQGLEVLYEVCAAIPEEIPVLLDGKVNDMGVTAEHYARGFFDELGVDALTIAPYMGEDAIEPYMRDAAKGVFILTKNSNPGSGQLQDRFLDSGERLYNEVASLCRQWDETYPASVGLVVGATYPEVFREIRERFPDGWILVPGIGEQGGSLEDSLANGLNAAGDGVLVSSSRSVLYASRGDDFADAAGAAAADLVRRVRQVRAS